MGHTHTHTSKLFSSEQIPPSYFCGVFLSFFCQLYPPSPACLQDEEGTLFDSEIPDAGASHTELVGGASKVDQPSSSGGMGNTTACMSFKLLGSI